MRLDSLTRGGKQPFESVRTEILRALKERKAVASLVAQGEAVLAGAKATGLDAAAEEASR